MISGNICRRGGLGSSGASLRRVRNLLAFFETDLDERLFYTRGLVALTSRRLLSTAPRWGMATARHCGGGNGHWPMGSPSATVSRVGSGVWRFSATGVGWPTPATPPARLRPPTALFSGVRRFSHQRGEVALSATVCPSCGAVIDSADGTCTTCAPNRQGAQVWSLMRLKPYAVRHARLILLGTVLTFVSTGVSLLPPYLTKGLLDDVLVPRSQGGATSRWSGSISSRWLDGDARHGSPTGDASRVLNYASECITADLRRDLRPPAAAVAGVLRRQADRRPDGAASAATPTGCATSCRSTWSTSPPTRADDPDDGRDPAGRSTRGWRWPRCARSRSSSGWSPRVRGRLLRGFRRAGVAGSRMTSVLADTIPGIRVVKAFAQERREIERFERGERTGSSHANDRLNRIWSLSSARR